MNGQTQKQHQQEILRDFKSRKYNVLVATCIAEECLDFGEVDLCSTEINWDDYAYPPFILASD